MAQWKQVLIESIVLIAIGLILAYTFLGGFEK
jgi:hypothetical protein